MSTRGRVLLVAVVLALAFALLGGEYSTFEWLDLRKETRAEEARVAELEREVDSLERYARKVETDPAVQERIAREVHGMLKPGEHAFILETPGAPEP